MHMQVVSGAVCKFEHRGFQRAKERWDSATRGQKTLRTIKLKIRANMGQCEPKERGFKELRGVRP
jgi:hypothetical protein